MIVVCLIVLVCLVVFCGLFIWLWFVLFLDDCCLWLFVLLKPAVTCVFYLICVVGLVLVWFVFDGFGFLCLLLDCIVWLLRTCFVWMLFCLFCKFI